MSGFVNESDKQERFNAIINEYFCKAGKIPENASDINKYIKLLLIYATYETVVRSGATKFNEHFAKMTDKVCNKSPVSDEKTSEIMKVMKKWQTTNGLDIQKTANETDEDIQKTASETDKQFEVRIKDIVNNAVEQYFVKNPNTETEEYNNIKAELVEEPIKEDDANTKETNPDEPQYDNPTSVNGSAEGNNATQPVAVESNAQNVAEEEAAATSPKPVESPSPPDDETDNKEPPNESNTNNEPQSSNARTKGIDGFYPDNGGGKKSRKTRKQHKRKTIPRKGKKAPKRKTQYKKGKKRSSKRNK